MFKKFKAWLTNEPPESLLFAPVEVRFAGTAHTVRRMHEKDIDDALMIERAIYGETPWNRLAFLSELRKSDNSLYLVVDGPAGVIAFIGCYLTKDEAHVTNLAVMPQFARRGIATYLMKLIEERAIAYGSEKLTLEVKTTNEEAIALYHKLGYQDGEVKRGYYVSTGEDARDMFLPLYH